MEPDHMDYLILKQVIHNLGRYCANYRAISGHQNEIGLCPLFITKKLIAYLAYVRNCVHNLFFLERKIELQEEKMLHLHFRLDYLNNLTKLFLFTSYFHIGMNWMEKVHL